MIDFGAKCLLLAVTTLLPSVALAAGPAIPSDGTEVAVSSGGSVLVTVSPDETLHVKDISGGPEQILGSPAGMHRFWPAAVATTSGARVTWVEGNEQGSKILTATFLASASPRPVLVSSAVSRWSRFPSVAMSPDGSLWIAWVDGTMETDNIVVSHEVNGSFSAPERVSAPDATEDLVPQIAFDATKAPVVVWAGRFGDKLDDILWSRKVGASWTPEERIHADNDVPDITPAMGRDQAGRLYVAWSSFDGKTSYQVFASRFDGKGWDQAQRLSRGTGAATLPVVVGASDHAVVLWNQYDGRDSIALARALPSHGDAREIVFPAPAPLGRSGRPLAFTDDAKLSLITADAVTTVSAGTDAGH